MIALVRPITLNFTEPIVLLLNVSIPIFNQSYHLRCCNNRADVGIALYRIDLWSLIHLV